MANECNDQARIAKGGEEKTPFGSPLSDHGYASGVFKSCRANNDSAMLQNHGFPSGDFWNGYKKYSADDKPLQGDGRDQARQDVMKNMPKDQQERVHNQEQEYQRRVQAFRDNMKYGTAMTRADYPDLGSPEFKDLKAREDAARKKTESK